jgi:hypothetical protein
MIGNDGLLNELRQIAGQPASIPALRASVFLFAILAALAWARRRPSLALLALSMGGFLGLGYWLVQIAAPLGFGTDPTATLEWAQASVNALAEPKGAGFVWGTEPGLSLVSALALAGIPLRFVFLVPQVATLVALGLAILLPFAFLKSRTTATLAASLVLGGGLWPGAAPYGSILLRPSALLLAVVLLAALLVLAGRRRVRRGFGHARLGISALLIAGAALGRAATGGAAPDLAAALLLSGATVVLTSPLRGALRRALTSPGRARRAEALLLLCAFGGSGLLWWNPPESVAGFHEARDVNAALLRPMDWIRRNVPTRSVVLASPAYSAPIAAFAGRRVLFPPSAEAGAAPTLGEPFRRARLAETTRLGQPLARLADAFSVTHLFLGPGEASPAAVAETSAADEPRLGLVLVYHDAKDFRVFQLVKK